jgi:hypothetical protein
MNKPRMILWLAGDWWMVDQPDNKEVLRLFGTSLLPTSYRSTMSKEEVIRRLQALNMDREVI